VTSTYAQTHSAGESIKEHIAVSQENGSRLIGRFDFSRLARQTSNARKPAKAQA
jgi:hypothetical protein